MMSFRHTFKFKANKLLFLYKKKSEKMFKYRLPPMCAIIFYLKQTRQLVAPPRLETVKNKNVEAAKK